nr:DUF5979 domain-containing protein [Corynebacterium sp. 76QC2CO]
MNSHTWSQAQLRNRFFPLAALLAVLALGFTLLSVGSHSAAAQETNKFELSNVKVTKTGSWPATVNDSLTFTADWAVKAGETVKAGDVMRIAFEPKAPLDFASNIGSFPLKRGAAEVATCQVTQDEIVCTFSNSVIAGAEAIGGAIQVGLVAKEEYTENSFPVTLNGELKTGTFDPATNSGTCVICPRTQGLGRVVSKSGSVDLRTNPGFVQWSITIPGPLLVDNKIEDLKIVDTVEGNHTFVADKLNLYMVTRNADGTNALGEGVRQYATDPTVSDDGKTLTATFPKPASGWNKEYKYEILYRTQLPENFIPANNEQFNNQFTVAGSESFSKNAVARVAQASGTADAASRVAVKKTVSGENLTEAQLAELKARTFTFDYTCGERSGTLEAPGDGTVVYSPITFTVGTKCTVIEDETQAAASGYKLTVSPQQAQVVIGTKNLAEFTNTYSPETTSETTTPETSVETTPETPSETTAVSTTSESTPSESTTPVTSTTESSSVPPVVVTSSSTESSTTESSTEASSTEPSTSTASSTVPPTPPTPAIPVVPVVPVVPTTPTVPAQPTQPAVPSSPTTEAAQATKPAQPAQTKRVLANTGVSVGVLGALALSALLGGLVLVARGRTTN